MRGVSGGKPRPLAYIIARKLNRTAICRNLSCCFNFICVCWFKNDTFLTVDFLIIQQFLSVKQKNTSRLKLVF